jgi:hypothetical protein
MNKRPVSGALRALSAAVVPSVPFGVPAHGVRLLGDSGRLSRVQPAIRIQPVPWR